MRHRFGIRFGLSVLATIILSAIPGGRAPMGASSRAADLCVWAVTLEKYKVVSVTGLLEGTRSETAVEIGGKDVVRKFRYPDNGSVKVAVGATQSVRRQATRFGLATTERAVEFGVYGYEIEPLGTKIGATFDTLTLRCDARDFAKTYTVRESKGAFRYDVTLSFKKQTPRR